MEETFDHSQIILDSEQSVLITPGSYAWLLSITIDMPTEAQAYRGEFTRKNRIPLDYRFNHQSKRVQRYFYLHAVSLEDIPLVPALNYAFRTGETPYYT